MQFRAIAPPHSLRLEMTLLRYVLLVHPLSVNDCVDIIFYIVPFIDAVNDHAFGDRDDVGSDFVQNADNGALIAAIGIGIGYKRIQFIGKFLFI